jgi:hypothetical protein
MQSSLEWATEVETRPDAAARGILLAVMLSSVLWLGLAISAWILW